MKNLGLEPERLQMHFCSAAEGQRFQKTMQSMSQEIEALGPSPLRALAAAPKQAKKKAKA